MMTMTRQCGWVAAALAATTSVLTPTAKAAPVQLYVVAPQPPNSMDWVEGQGTANPWFSRDVSMPYSTLEPLIRDQIKAQIDGTRSGKVIVTDPAPDVDWSVTLSSNFKFLQANQPTITAFGDPQQNGVEVKLHTQVKISLNAAVSAETWFDSAAGNVPLDVVLDVDASSKVHLWPVVQSSDLQFELTLVNSNVDLSGLNGEAIELGAKLGAVLGVTPIGALLGGPLAPLFFALGADVAMDVAQDKVNDLVSDKLNAQLGSIAGQLEEQVRKVVTAGLTQVNNVKDKLLNTPLPGVNASYSQLSSALGLTLDVQTTTLSGGVRVIVTPRFNAQPGNGTITGRIRIPRGSCIYMKNKIAGVFPLGLKAVNQDLASSVGEACSTVFGAQDFLVRGYLGGDPHRVSGGGAVALPQWKQVGQATFTGNLKVQTASEGGPQLDADSSGYYECAFQITGLPAADIVEVTPTADLADRMTDFYDGPTRFFETAAPKLLLDSDWYPLPWLGANAGATLGGGGQCSGGGGGRGFDKPFWEELAEKFDPEKCPQCNIQITDNNYYEVTNPAALNPEVRSFIDSVTQQNVRATAVQTQAVRNTQVNTAQVQQLTVVR